MIIEGSPLATVLDPTHRDLAVALLRGYFAPGAFEGAHFERLARGGDRPEVQDEFTSDDLVAITMLGVTLKPAAALEILEVRRDSLRAALAAIPNGVHLTSLGAEEIGPDWPVRRLLDALVAIPGIGTTKATKLMARKRPHLVPILDSVVNETLSITKERYWGPLHAWLTADDGANGSYLEALREDAGIGSDISVLRVFDILAWRTGRGDAGRTAS